MIVSRGISGTVSDASGIQQQGAYILRVIGQQLRQTGSLYLNPDPAGGTSTDVLSPVAFEIKADKVGSGNSFEQESTLAGASDTVTTGFRRYPDNVFMVAGTEAAASTPATFGTDYLARNCVGAPGNSSTDQRVESIFTFNSAKNELRCGGNGASAQPIAQNVAQFQVVYMVQTTDAAGTKVQYTKGSDMPAAATDPAWRQVQGVQVCLVLYGSEPIDMPAGSSYTDCSGTSVNMTTLTGDRKNRMHLLFRNTFQLRSQGLV
ncbi:MAG: prepilin-type cleavage/methylation domain-containing protein [Acidovorax sp. 17-64-282]|nr:MAG: prepilin-type cleavage/methylation domain-containing protein [Acidovorax sp. 17-64-282]